MFNDFFSKLQAQARSLTANLDKEGRNVSNVELLQILGNAGFIWETNHPFTTP